MEYDDAVKRAGRIVYIEPNNINNLHPSNSIPYPYEDYAISVNLRVYMGNRYSCGFPDDFDENWYKKFSVEYSTNRGTISFIGGTNGYLSTNFTDISMNDPMSNTHECLGIESINIAYNSWMYPQVNIKFIDVRGASLMLPAEYEKYNSPESDFKATGSATFFNALFSFPYPMFKLSVKGFYGKEITYDLCVSDVKINFNSTTGNLEANVSFIGYMYGVYSEIPMSLISIAPYTEYGPKGKEYWKHEKDAGHFVFTDGNNIDSEMLTYPELLSAVDNISENAKKILRNSEEGKRMKAINTLFRKIGKVKAKYQEFRNSWQTYELKGQDGYSLLYMPVDVDNEDVEAIDAKEREVIKKANEFRKEVEAYNKLAHQYEHLEIQTLHKETELNGIAEEYANQMKNANGDENKVKFDDISKEYLSFVVFTVTNDPSDAGKKTINTLEGDGKLRINASVSDCYKDFIDAVKNGEKLNNSEEVVDKTGIRKKLLSKNSPKYLKVYLFRLHQKSPLTEISNIEEKLQDEKKALTKKLKDIKKESMREGLGFNPTIRNMFNLTFAHMNTFMELFYECLSRIKSQITARERLIRKYVGGNVMCDINEYYVKNATEDGSLPPFTMFYQEKVLSDAENGDDKTYELIWPGNLPDGENLEEVKLVRALVSATKMYQGKLDASFRKDTLKKETNKENASIAFFPLTPYDFVHPYTNQYINVLSKTINRDTILDRILFIFALRCYYFFYMNFGDTSVEGDNILTALNNGFFEKYGKIEAENIFRALDTKNLTCSNALNSKLLSTANNIGGYVENFLNKNIFSDGFDIIPGKNRTAIFGKVATNGTPLKYKWLTNDGKYYLPIGGTFNINNICSDTDNGSLSRKEEYVNVSNFSENKSNFHIISDSSVINGLLNVIYHDNEAGETISGLYNNFTRNIKEVKEDIGMDGYIKSYLSPHAKALIYSGGILTFKSIKSKFSSTDNIKGTDFNILYPSVVLSNVGTESVVSNILFAHPIYYMQTDQLSRTYLFLCGLPVAGNKYILDSAISSTVPKTLLLREGAFYWRRKKMEEGSDPIILSDPDNENRILYKSAAADEVYSIEYGGNNFLYPIPVNDSQHKYIKITEPSGITQGRIDGLIKYFEDFAKSTDFTTIDNAYSLYVIEKNGEITSTRRIKAKELCTTKTENLRKNGIYINYGVESVYGKVRDKLIPLGTNEDGNFDAEVESTYETNQVALKRLFGDFDTVIDYAVPFAKNPVVSYDGLKKSMTAFIEELVKRTKPEQVVEEHKDEVVVTDDRYGSEDFLISVYDMLRVLYNKWLCSNSKDIWYFNAMGTDEEMANSDFGKFKYMDNFYHNIGDKLIVGLDSVVSLLKENTIEKVNSVSSEPVSNSNSIYRYLAAICERNQMVFLALPSMYGLTFDETGDSIKDMFRPIPFNEGKSMNNKSSTYVALYAYKLSEHLDIKSESGQYGFKNDGCNIADSKGNILAPVPAPFADGNENSMLVPAFGVTFAKQNQSYFKNIQLNMNDHQQTEASLRTMFNIAAKGTQTPRSTQIFGQDLYRVYSSYSYMCTVDMMGNAQVTPLMYFQLNNIPMWNGLYMIIKVTHSINGNGDMTTNFTGVRISSYSTPYVEPDLIFIDDDFPEDEKYEEEEEQDSDIKTEGTKGDSKSVGYAHEQYQKVYSKFVKGDGNYDGSTTNGSNIYTPVGNGFDITYLSTMGYNDKVDENVLTSYSGDKYPEGQSRTVKYLIVHSCGYEYQEAVMNHGSYPPYNIYIDGEGKIHYPWYHLGNSVNDTNMFDREATTSSKNYKYCSMNLAFYGTYAGGKLNVSDATIKTLQQYILAFNKAHPNVKIVGYNQIGYAENDGNTLSPGFHMPTLLSNLKISNAAVKTDMNNFMAPCSNDRTYIDGNDASIVYDAGSNEWKKQTEPKKSGLSRPASKAGGDGYSGGGHSGTR